MSEECVAVFWDVASCPVPADLGVFEAASRVRQVTRQFGKVVHVQVYAVAGSESEESPLHSGLRSSGLNVTSYDHESQNAVGKIVADMFSFALDHEAPATVVLISGNSGFSYALSVLTWRNYNVVSVAGDRSGICAQTSMNLHWQRDVLKFAEQSEWSSRTPSPVPSRVSLRDPAFDAGHPSKDGMDETDFKQSEADNFANVLLSGNQPTISATSDNVPRGRATDKVVTASSIPSPAILDTPRAATPSLDLSNTVTTPIPRPSSSMSYSSTYPTQVPVGQRERMLTPTLTGTKGVIPPTFPNTTVGLQHQPRRPSRDEYPFLAPEKPPIPAEPTPEEIQAPLPASPSNFTPLIEIMGLTGGGGGLFNSNILKTRVLAKDPLVFERLGVTDWVQFIGVAQRAGVIHYDGQNPNWVRLNPRFYQLLVTLVQLRRAGVVRPSWSIFSAQAKKAGLVTYSQDGAKNLQQYLELASDIGLVFIGNVGSAGSEWVALR